MSNLVDAQELYNFSIKLNVCQFFHLPSFCILIFIMSDMGWAHVPLPFPLLALLVLISDQVQAIKQLISCLMISTSLSVW